MGDGGIRGLAWHFEHKIFSPKLVLALQIVSQSHTMCVETKEEDKSIRTTVFRLPDYNVWYQMTKSFIPDKCTVCKPRSSYHTGSLCFTTCAMRTRCVVTKKQCSKPIYHIFLVQCSMCQMYGYKTPKMNSKLWTESHEMAIINCKGCFCLEHFVFSQGFIKSKCICTKGFRGKDVSAIRKS